MSIPHEPEKVKLVVSLFSPEKDLIPEILAQLEDDYGKTDWISSELFFDRTRYYEAEMGWPLHRRFAAFEQLIFPEALIEVKHKAYEIERLYLSDEKRRINIDPGYISPERLILATGKNFTHRVYLGKGVYADLTLIFQKGTFRPLEWTYPDYASPEVIEFLNHLRAVYMKQLKEV